MGGQTAQFAFGEVRMATTFAELSFNATLAALPAAVSGVSLVVPPRLIRGSTRIQFVIVRS